ncbi:GNAT family N-acetyltransferase [Paenibacillus wynnii]|uniref:N-acetyltransferase domain-containing protein n=1 Tax=Paenibacillus wynnii TaxID=268407 RepID=A0A098M6A9_9BACL|nr:GNAT family N-acetyltransferase [Paenibacillus wynnii]KGE17077.1 hypothetical protein PWYN_20690 [Paenibacillus wynnii]
MIISRAEKTDLKEILDLQYSSYRSEAVLYNDFTIQPLKQTIEELRQEFDNSIILKAQINGRIVGSVRAISKENLTCNIGKLIVHPDFQNRGIGRKLMKSIEDIFSHTKRFELFTGHRSKKNLNLYWKLGYTQHKSEEVNQNLTLIFLNKIIES